MAEWTYEDESDNIVELSDAGTAIHLLKSVFFLNGNHKSHWNSIKHPRDAHGRWAPTFNDSRGLSGGRSSRVFGVSRPKTFKTEEGSPNITHQVHPGDRVYQTDGGSHVIVHPDGSGVHVGKYGTVTQLSGRGVDGVMGSKGESKAKLVDHQPGIQVHADSDEEAEKVLKSHENIDKKYADKHPDTVNYTPKHASATEDVSSDVPEKDDVNDLSSLNLQPGDELRRSAKDNNTTMVLHHDGTSTLFDAKSGKATNNSVNKTQGLLLGNSDVSEALAGKKAWSSLDARGISSAQKSIDTRWPVIHKEPMTATTFNHSEHGAISANYSDAKNIVAKEHPNGIAVRNTHTGATLVHKKDGTVSKFSGSVNDFNALPDAKPNDEIAKANEKNHEHNTLGGGEQPEIGSEADQKSSYRQEQQATGKGIKQESLGGVDSAGDLKLPQGAGESNSVIIQNEAELKIIMSTFEQLGIKSINGVPLNKYFNVQK